MFLKQSTSVVKSFGPFVDKGDGVTPETGLVSAIDHATTGIMLSKNGSAFAIRSQAVTASTYDAYGNYLVTLSTTDTGTIGALRMQFIETATCLPVWQDFHVLAANVYDSLFGAATDKLDVNVEEWNTTAVPAEHTAGYPVVTVKDGTGTGEINTNAGAIALVDLVTLTSTLTTYTGNTLQTGDSFARIGATGSGLSTLATQASVNVIDGIVDDILVDTGTTLQGELDGIQADTEDIQARLPAALTGDGNIKADSLRVGGTLQTAGDLAALIVTVDTVVDAILVDTAELQTDWVNGGRLDLILDIIAADVVNLDGAAMRGTDSAATAANLATVAGYLDTEIAAILADTNELQTDWANGGRLDLILDIIAVDVAGLDGAAMRGTDSAGTAAELAKVPKSDSNVTWNATALASINAEADTALNDYDGPTNAELTTALGTADDAVLARLGAPAGASMSADIAAIKTQTAAIETDTAEIGTAGAGLTNINLPNQTMDIVGNITGNLSGSVGSVTTAITLPTIPTAWITADGIATDAFGALEVAAGAASEIATAVRTELATELARIDVAVSTVEPTAAEIRTAVGLASANLDTQLGDLPTNAELATALGTADDTVLAAIAALDDLSSAQIQTACAAAIAAAEPIDANITQVGGVAIQPAGTGGQGYGN